MRKLYYYSVIVLATALFFFKNTSLQAQIVNIENKRSNLADTSGVFGYLSVGANFVKNTKSITTISGDIRIELLHKRSKFLSLTNYNLIRSNNDRFIDNGFSHLRYNYGISKKIRYEFFTQAQFNKQVRLQLRALVGTGFRFQVYEAEKQQVYFGISYMYEYNEVEIISDVVSFFYDHRMSTYLSASIQPFSENVTISNTTYYQPVLTNFSEVRLSSQTSLNFLLSKRLLFSTIFSITNDTRVPENVPATYYSVRNGIRWDF
ncbi:MAG: DUF481 domain-containing protein [Saprospiraceae bacterium]